MKHRKQKTALERFIEAAEKTGNETLRWYYQRKMLKDQLLDKQTRNALVEEITENVLKNLSIRIDISDAIQEIEQLKKAIAHLGQKGKH